MKKEAFLNELRSRLSGLPQTEAEDRISFFGEMIDARTEDGMSEEEAVAAMEPVDSIVSQIMSEIPLSSLVMNTVRPEKKRKAWKTVLLIVLFPIWFPVFIAFSAVIFALLVAAWSVIFSFFVTSFSLILGSVACMAACALYFVLGRPFAGVFGIGAVLICISLGILFFLLSVGMSRGTVKLTGKLFTGLKTCFVGRGN